MPPDLPEVGRRGSVAGFRAALRFLRTDGGYHAAPAHLLDLGAVPGRRADLRAARDLRRAPPRPPRAAVVSASAATMLLWIALTVGFREFADAGPGYDANYGVFATLIVGLIWLWLTNVSVLLGGAFAHELDPRS
jgi:Virulence factor BrkB